MKKKVTTPFFLRAPPRQIFIHTNWRQLDLWEETFYEKVLRRLHVPVHNTLEQCLPTRNGRTCKRRSLGGIFLRSGKYTRKSPPISLTRMGTDGDLEAFRGVFIDTTAGFMHCIHHTNTGEGNEVAYHGKER